MASVFKIVVYFQRVTGIILNLSKFLRANPYCPPCLKSQPDFCKPGCGLYAGYVSVNAVSANLFLPGAAFCGTLRPCRAFIWFHFFPIFFSPPCPLPLWAARGRLDLWIFLFMTRANSAPVSIGM